MGFFGHEFDLFSSSGWVEKGKYILLVHTIINAEI